MNGVTRRRIFIVKAALLIAFVAFMTVPVRAEFRIGNELYEECERSPNLAYTYTFGFIDSHELFEPILPRQFCVPRGVTGKQAFDIACSYLKNHPESRHLPAAMLLNRAFTQAWPCK